MLNGGLQGMTSMQSCISAGKLIPLPGVSKGICIVPCCTMKLGVSYWLRMILGHSSSHTLHPAKALPIQPGWLYRLQRG